MKNCNMHQINNSRLWNTIGLILPQTFACDQNSYRTQTTGMVYTT